MALTKGGNLDQNTALIITIVQLWFVIFQMCFQSIIILDKIIGLFLGSGTLFRDSVMFVVCWFLPDCIHSEALNGEPVTTE